MRSGLALALLVVALFTIGVVMVNSASLELRLDPSLAMDVEPDGTATGFSVTFERVLLGKYIKLALVAMAALALAAFLPVERIRKGRGFASPIPWIAIMVVGALLLTFVPGIGVTQNGAARWVKLGPIGFQPSEIAKWCMPLLIAWYVCRQNVDVRRFGTGLLPPLVFAAVVCGLVAIEDLGTGVLIMLVVLGVLLAAGVRVWQVACLVPLGGLAFAGLVLAEPYRVRRIVSFWEPYADPGDSGYHLVQSLSAIAGGGPMGRGLGHSLQKFGYLPEINSDFIFALICEELGIFGAALVVSIFMGILLFGLSIVLGRSVPNAEIKSTDTPLVPRFSQLVGLGVLLTFGLQAFINIAVVSGWAPTKGIALPLVSHGGTGWILTSAALGLVVSIDRSAWRRARERTESTEEKSAVSATPVVA